MKNRLKNARGNIPANIAIVVYGISSSISRSISGSGEDIWTFCISTIFSFFIFLDFFGLMTFSTVADIVSVQRISLDHI